MSAGHVKPDLVLHASCVAVSERAVMLRGASGSGKSALALQLMALGAKLVADDRTCLLRNKNRTMAFAPDPILGLIEARGVGLFRVSPAPPTPVALVVDLDRVETERLPEPRTTPLLGQSIPLLAKVDAAHFPAAILHYLTTEPWSET
jgi:HPr kinase/phosphorylase